MGRIARFGQTDSRRGRIGLGRAGVARTLGRTLGLSFGRAVGLSVGRTVGLSVGRAVGLAVAMAVGRGVAAAVGEAVVGLVVDVAAVGEALGLGVAVT